MNIIQFDEQKLKKLNPAWDGDFFDSSMERYMDEIFSAYGLVRVGNRYSNVILFNKEQLNDRILRLINIPLVNALLYDRNNCMEKDFLEYFYDAMYPMFEDLVEYNNLYLNSYDYVFEFLDSKDLIYKSYEQAKEIVETGGEVTHRTGKQFFESDSSTAKIYQSGWTKNEIIK